MHVVDVALGVGPARDREADEVHGRRGLGPVGVPPEHDGADLAAADPALVVEGDGQRLAGVVERRDVGEEGPGVEVDGVAADRPDDGHARLRQRLAEIGGAGDPVAQVVIVDHLAQALGDRLEVAAGEAAVGREALGEDEEIAALLGQAVVVHRQPAADVGEAVLLRAHGHAVGQRGDLAHDLGHAPVALAGLAGLDEPGVLGEAAGVEEEGHAVAVADRADPAQVLQAHRLAAAGVVGDRHEDGGDLRRAALGEERVEPVEVHVPLEGVLDLGVAPLLDDEVDGLGARELDVGPGRVEVGVVGDRLAGPADHGEEDLLGGASLVGGDDVAEREEVLDRLQEGVPRRGARVALVAVLDGRPLVAAHGAGAGVGEQVDEDVVGVEVEEVEAGLLDGEGTLGAGGDPDRLDGVDPERLDDRLPAFHGR